METRGSEVRVLAAMLVLSLCGLARAVDGAGLIAHWQFDEGEGSVAYDSADGYDGTVYGAQWTTGVLGGALDFDGFDDYVGLPDNNPIWLPQSNFTLCAWVLFDTTPASSESMILDLNYGHSGSLSNALGCVLCINPVVEELGFGITTTTSLNEDLLTDSVLLAEKWYHLVAVRDGTFQGLYIDGQLDASRTCSPSPIKYFGTYDDDRVNIGVESKSYNPSIRHHDGLIDDVRIYNRALSDEEIQRLYEGALAVKVGVDIKPGGCPNPMNLASRGIFPAAILGTEDFDAEEIDPTSIRLKCSDASEGIAAVRSSLEDVATPVSDGSECDCTMAGPDGYTDLALKFRTSQVADMLVFEVSETDYGTAEDSSATLALTITGKLYDGTPIEGSDCVVLVGKVPEAIIARKADINKDGVVNALDFAMLAQEWVERAPLLY